MADSQGNVFILDPNVYSETVAVYCENHMEHTKSFETKWRVLTVKRLVHIVTTVFQNG
jgi:hypothetical protein